MRSMLQTLWFFILFFTDHSTAPNPACRGPLLKSEYLLTSPNYPTTENPEQVYPPNTDCAWYYIGDGENTAISFKFWDLIIQIGARGSDVTCDYDYVNVSITSIGSKLYCGYKSPEKPIVGVGSLHVTFHSDGVYNLRGFQATYSFLDGFNPCDPNPCKHGDCSRKEDKIRTKCECFPGATGERCDVDIKECESNPCQNGAHCDDTSEINTYICTCPPKWEGVNCELEKPPPCTKSPCLNGGTCEELEKFEYKCHCEEAYEGVDCEIETGCGNPGIPYLKEGRRFFDKTKLNISCSDGYVLDGKSKITCIDGAWSPSLPECISDPSLDGGSISPWACTMIVLCIAMACNATAFTLWMIYRGPCVEPKGNVSVWKFQRRNGAITSVSSVVSEMVDDVFEDERSADMYSLETSSYASSYQL